MGVNVTVVVGNPKPKGHTWEVAHRVGEALGPVTASIDVIELGPSLLGWGDDGVKEAVARVAASEIAVFASPTYKAAYTGVLKTFLDKFAGDTGLAGVVAVPLQLGGSPVHALSPELHLKPVLVELGAIVPAPALYLVDGDEPDPAEAAWVGRWAPVVRAAVVPRPLS